MIVTCSGCNARYKLDASKVPPREIRVRCPECAAVFTLDGTRREAPAAQVEPTPQAAAPEPTPVQTPPSPPAEPTMPPAPEAPPASGADDLALEPPAAAASVDPAVATPPAAPTPAPPQPAKPQEPAPEAGSAPSEPSTATAVAEEAPRSGRRRRRDKTEMLARALVSDILVYNREIRDKALADGNLLEALGPEIKKSWELYKEKVGAEAASNTSYFKDALNEILAEGNKVF
ncbi:hypothetical protein GF314_00600 [bacterium]|nr:hypothetical protein [bacterium]